MRKISSMNIMKNNKAGFLLILLVLLQAWEGSAGSNRIIGPGDTTYFRKNSFPWLVKIYASQKEDTHFSVHHCGGTLLNSRTVLSAAHCTFSDKNKTKPIPPQMMTLYLGEHDTHSKEFGEKKVKAARIVVHPNFKGIAKDNDFAIIYMDEEIKESNIIRYACLSRPNNRYLNTTVTVAGWGATRPGGGIENRARKVDLVTISNRDCNANFWNGLTDNMICASGKSKGTCKGDSGGPLMVKGRENLVIGVSSFGEPGCSTDYPSVFARVSSQLRWIKRMAGNICTE